MKTCEKLTSWMDKKIHENTAYWFTTSYVAHGRKYVSEILGFEASKSEGQQKLQACVRSCPLFPIPPNWLWEKILYFEWSPPWHLFVIVSPGTIFGIIFWHSILVFYLASYLTFHSGILSGIYSDILSGILCGICTHIFSSILSGIFSAICSGIRSGMLSGILSDILFWHSIWHLFWHSCLGSLWLRSGGEHSDPELVVEVRRGTL